MCFSFLGLAADARNAAFDNDYKRPLNLVVLKYAKEFVRVGCGPQMLHSAGLEHRESEFPSWVPDWTKGAPFFLKRYPRNLYQAAGSSLPDMKAVEMENILVVRGLTFDKIIKLSHCAHDHAARNETSSQPLFNLVEECDQIVSDITAIFLGCPIPFIIRKCDERGNHFRLIGKRPALSAQNPRAYGQVGT